MPPSRTGREIAYKKPAVAPPANLDFLEKNLFRNKGTERCNACHTVGMNHKPNRTPSSGVAVIYFPALECWNPLAGVATIAADIDKKRICCRISIEVLQEKFHASAENPMHAVKANRPIIEAAARKLIENRAYKEDGSIMIESADFEFPPSAL